MDVNFEGSKAFVEFSEKMPSGKDSVRVMGGCLDCFVHLCRDKVYFRSNGSTSNENFAPTNSVHLYRIHSLFIIQVLPPVLVSLKLAQIINNWRGGTKSNSNPINKYRLMTSADAEKYLAQVQADIQAGNYEEKKIDSHYPKFRVEPPPPTRLVGGIYHWHGGIKDWFDAGHDVVLILIGSPTCSAITSLKMIRFSTHPADNFNVIYGNIP